MGVNGGMLEFVAAGINMWLHCGWIQCEKLKGLRGSIHSLPFERHNIQGFGLHGR